MTTQQKQFEQSAELYRIELCKIWETPYSDTYWIGDEVGGMLDIGGGQLTISYDDVRYIVDNHIGLSEANEWYEYNSSISYIKEYLSHVNLRSWHNGEPHVDAFRWDAELMSVVNGN